MDQRSRYGVTMPYEVCFTKKLEIKDLPVYINECCWGGDVVRDRLLPSIEAGFGEVQTHQEDWGWFIWIRRERSSMDVDIFCDDPAEGRFRMHISLRVHGFLSLRYLDDSEELRELLTMVCAKIEAWGSPCQVRQITL